jgi:hypothetical protein
MVTWKAAIIIAAALVASGASVDWAALASLAAGLPCDDWTHCLLFRGRFDRGRLGSTSRRTTVKNRSVIISARLDSATSLRPGARRLARSQADAGLRVR